MKKTVCGILVVLFTAAFCFAGGSGESSGGVADWPEKGKPVILMCPFGAGGGFDINLRMIAPFLEKHLGTTVTVQNITGANGWVCWNQVIKAKPDGYILAGANYPTQIAGYLDPAANIPYTFRDFTILSNYVRDVNILVCRVDETRFRTAAEMVNYAKEHELTVFNGGRGSDDHVVTMQMNKELGTKFRPVHLGMTAEGTANMLGGHIDGLVCNISDVIQRHRDGDLKIVAQFSRQRTSFLPDVPTFEEAGFPGIYGDTSRGLVAPPNMDPVLKEKILKVLKDVMEDPEHKAAAEKAGIFIDSTTMGPDFEKQIAEVEKKIIDLKEELGM
jgi:tripartite-type tricarboxylate transporter receptor subunit TctC